MVAIASYATPFVVGSRVRIDWTRPAITYGYRCRLLLPIVSGLLILLSAPLQSQQVPDTAFRPSIAKSEYRYGEGPLVMVDEAHNNSHTLEGNFRPFAELLRQDGYRVEPIRKPFSGAALSKGNILVIINALGSRNVGNWSLPTPSAFSSEEVAEIREWVRGGGALLLVADHMPFPGATEALAAEFGVAFMNGFAIDTVQWDPLMFRRADGTLARHPIMEGREPMEKLDSIATFWGQAFRTTDSRVRELLVFGRGVVSLNPDTAWRFTDNTAAMAVEGWLQGAALRCGNGRVVILGEAGMLTAQLMGPNRVPIGMNAPIARQNLQFVLSVMRWLSDVIPEPND